MDKRKILNQLRKRVIVCSLALVMMAVTFSACGKEAQLSVDTTDETTQSADTTQQIEAEVVVEETTEEAVEENISEESEVEMVDFETWAKQEGNDEVCLVVWNETTGTQEIIQPKKKYIIKEGDRFAIPYRELIVSVNVEREMVEWENLNYLELDLPYVDDGTVQVDIMVFGGTATEVKSYLLANE